MQLKYDSFTTTGQRTFLRDFVYVIIIFIGLHYDGLVQGCDSSNALAMELLQSYTEPSIYFSCLVDSGIIQYWYQNKLTNYHANWKYGHKYGCPLPFRLERLYNYFNYFTSKFKILNSITRLHCFGGK